MIKQIKTWFSPSPEENAPKFLNVQAELISARLDVSLIKEIKDEVVKRVVEQFFEENRGILDKEILKDPTLLPAIYNAVVLKKANELMR